MFDNLEKIKREVKELKDKKSALEKESKIIFDSKIRRLNDLKVLDNNYRKASNEMSQLNLKLKPLKESLKDIIRETKISIGKKTDIDEQIESVRKEMAKHNNKVIDDKVKREQEGAELKNTRKVLENREIEKNKKDSILVEKAKQNKLDDDFLEKKKKEINLAEEKIKIKNEDLDKIIKENLEAKNGFKNQQNELDCKGELDKIKRIELEKIISKNKELQMVLDTKQKVLDTAINKAEEKTKSLKKNIDDLESIRKSNEIKRLQLLKASNEEDVERRLELLQKETKKEVN